MQKIIEFEDKVALNENSSIPEINKVTDDNINEIKSIVNGSLQGTNAMGSIVVDDVKCKNLCDITTVKIGKTWNNENDNNSATVFVPVKPNTIYTISFSNSPFDAIFLIEKNSIASSTATVNAVQITSPTTRTTNANTNYIAISFGYVSTAVTLNDFANIKVQLELGDTNTNIVPYKKIIKEQNGYVKENTTFYANDFKCRNIANLINFTQTANQSSTYKDIGIVYLEAGTYTLSWTQSASMTSNSRNTPGYTGTATAWQTQNTNVNMSAGRSSWTFTINNAGIYTFRWWINTPSTTVNMTDFMLEKGNEVTSYTPFKSFGEDVYSENEIKVGTWIDGKPIYRKAFEKTSLTTGENTFSIGISNVQSVINLQCNVYRNNGYWHPLTFANSNNLNVVMSVVYLEGNISVNIGSGITNASKCVGYIEYTKTTSGTRSIEMEEENNDNR